MVVGRTLWDFIVEVTQKPELMSLLLVLLVLSELVFIILILLVQGGFLGIKLSYGGIQVELQPLALMRI